MPRESVISAQKIEKPEVSIRIGTPEDWKEYKKIRLEAIDNDPDAFAADPNVEKAKKEEDWKKKLEDPSVTVFLVKESDKTVGLAVSTKREDGRWWITSVYVSPALRSSHIGEKLVAEALEKMKEAGAKEAHLNVRVSQVPAISLYKKLGFKQKQETVNDQGKKLYYMSKKLS